MFYFTKVCLFCLNANSDLIKINKNNVIFHDVRYVIPEFKLPVHEGLLHICRTCHNSIRSFSKLKQKFLENNKVLGSYFNILEDINNSLENKEEFLIQSFDIKEFGQEIVIRKTKNIPCALPNKEETKEIKKVDDIIVIEDSDSENERHKLLSIKSENIYKELNYKNNNKNHTKTQKVKGFNCLLCNKKFAFKNALILHSKKHTEKNKLKCTLCNKDFISAHKLKLHVKIHKDLQSLKCTVCFKEMPNIPGLNAHMKIHSQLKEFECHMCDKRFSRKYNLNVHIKSH